MTRQRGAAAARATRQRAVGGRILAPTQWDARCDAAQRSGDMGALRCDSPQWLGACDLTVLSPVEPDACSAWWDRSREAWSRDNVSERASAHCLPGL